MNNSAHKHLNKEANCTQTHICKQINTDANQNCFNSANQQITTSNLAQDADTEQVKKRT